MGATRQAREQATAKVQAVAALGDWWASCEQQPGGSWSVLLPRADGGLCSLGHGSTAALAWCQAAERIAAHGVPKLRQLAGF